MNELIKDLKDIKLAIFDLDGVVYRGDKLIPEVDIIIRNLQENSIKVLYNSNNSTATRQTYVKRLSNFNIDCSYTDFYTSASITAIEIKKIKPKSKIFVIGEKGLKEELAAQGHDVIDDMDDLLDVDFVIVGLDRNFTYKKLAIAQKHILEGKAKFYATNADATLPINNGILPGAGVMVNALKTCTNQKPKKIFGKPNPKGIELILQEHKVNVKDAVIFGDRLDTDIAAGNRAGIRTVLVLTGVTSLQQIDELKKDPKTDPIIIPTLVINSLKEIFI